MRTKLDAMSANTDDDELQRALILTRVIDRQPKLFQKWSELKDRFMILGLYDSPFKETTFTVEDALRMINEAFDDDQREPAIIS